MIEPAIRIICVCDFFLPGFKGGGPIRTLANMRTILKGRAELSIFTRDRDLGSNISYGNVRKNEWNSAEHGPIFYASPRRFNSRMFFNVIDTEEFDVLYLNSFFSFKSSISILLRNRINGSRSLPVLLAPRGEFSHGALSIKGMKKRVFLRLAKFFKIYQYVYWHASSAQEYNDIIQQFPKAIDKIFIASNPVSISPYVLEDSHDKESGSIRIVFISRICRMKNLAGLLKILSSVDREIRLSINGPIEDEPYWQLCRELIKTLPKNVHVVYEGTLLPSQVSRKFSDFDLFVFPTEGENFGHVIFESLRVGTPVLVSDNTPWVEDADGAISVVPLRDIDLWRKTIEKIADNSAAQQQELRRSTIRYVERYIDSSEMSETNLEMFEAVANR